MQHFSEARVVYDCIDELEIFESSGKKRLALDHDSLLREAALVVASSDRLADQVRLVRSEVLLCPNGVDHGFFARCLSEKFPVPMELKPLLDRNIPLAGYYGALANWVDYELLSKVARAFPSWAIILIGPDHDGSLPASHLLQESNVYWLGPKPYSVLPHYLQSLSAAMIPFQINSLTLSASPIKLLEYLAAGKAVVSVDLPECRKHAGALVAKNGEGFVELLARAHSTCRDPLAQAARSQAVLSEDWKERAQSIASAVAPSSSY